MRRRGLWIGAGVLVLALCWLTAEALAFVTRPTHLKDQVSDNQFILVARVEKLEPQRPAMILVAEEDLKGKFPYRRLPVNLTGDELGKKHNHTPEMLKRLAVDLRVVLFVSQRGSMFTAFGYTNGTWFQMIATKPKDDDKVVWAFT